AQAKSKQAEAFGQEGWFDRSDMPTANAQDTWKAAADMWHRFGVDNALEPDERHRKELEEKTKIYVEKYPELARPRTPPPSYMMKNPEVADGYNAFNELSMYQGMKHLANYEHWKLASEINSTDDAMKAYRFFYNGSRRRSDFAFSTD